LFDGLVEGGFRLSLRPAARRAAVSWREATRAAWARSSVSALIVKLARYFLFDDEQSVALGFLAALAFMAFSLAQIGERR